jgi:hypothetical protein
MFKTFEINFKIKLATKKSKYADYLWTFQSLFVAFPWLSLTQIIYIKVKVPRNRLESPEEGWGVEV